MRRVREGADLRVQVERQQASLASHAKDNTGLSWLAPSFSILALKYLWRRRRKCSYDFKDMLMELTFSYPLMSVAYVLLSKHLIPWYGISWGAMYFRFTWQLVQHCIRQRHSEETLETAAPGQRVQRGFKFPSAELKQNQNLVLLELNMVKIWH